MVCLFSLRRSSVSICPAWQSSATQRRRTQSSPQWLSWTTCTTSAPSATSSTAFSTASTTNGRSGNQRIFYTDISSQFLDAIGHLCGVSVCPALMLSGPWTRECPLLRTSSCTTTLGLYCCLDCKKKKKEVKMFWLHNPLKWTKTR